MDIHHLVEEGVRNFREIERGIKACVKFDLFEEQVLPDLSNRRFHSTKTDLRNHYYLAFAKRKLAKLGQDSVSQLVEKWKTVYIGATVDNRASFLFNALWWIGYVVRVGQYRGTKVVPLSAPSILLKNIPFLVPPSRFRPLYSIIR